MFALIATPILCTILSANLPYKAYPDAYKDKALNCGLSGVISWNVTQHYYTKLTVKSLWGVDKDYVVVIRIYHNVGDNSPHDESIILTEDEYDFLVKSLPNARFEEVAYSGKDNVGRSILLPSDPHKNGGVMIQQFISTRNERGDNCGYCKVTAIFTEVDIKKLLFFYPKLSKFVNNYRGDTLAESAYEIDDAFFMDLPNGPTNKSFVPE